MKIGLAQINLVVGDIPGNLAKIRQRLQSGARDGADLVVFPELALTGYPPRDLLEQKAFVEANLKALETLAREVRTPAAVVGYVDRHRAPTGRPLHNAAALLSSGRIVARRFKSLLPTYDVFDEDRYFEPARENATFVFKGIRIGLSICEDAWNDPSFWPRQRYHKDPIERFLKEKAKVVINISASPFHKGRISLRREMMTRYAKRGRLTWIHVNQVGGNDELVFDGNSFVLDGKGRLVAHARGFEEDQIFIDLDQTHPPLAWMEPEEVEQVYRALVLGTRDYTRKCGFRDVLVGLSGGIDSSLTAALAVAALGREHVTGVAMPSMYSSEESLGDAQTLAQNLGIRLEVLPITDIFRAYEAALQGLFAGLSPDVTEENLQARIRGTLLMALSNKWGSLLLSTGNKSELSMGYCTLYGDMSGGLAVISDVPKGMIYALGRFINKGSPVIPERVFIKPPSAELRPHQTDQDTLPPYDVLDAIFTAYIEEGKDFEEISRQGFDRSLVTRVLNTIDRSEYKRRQAAPGLKITPKAFGVGRRMPIARGVFR